MKFSSLVKGLRILVLKIFSVMASFLMLSPLILSSTILLGFVSSVFLPNQAQGAASAEEYACDLQSDLSSKSFKFKEHNSEVYKQVYAGIYSDYENSIRKICEFSKKCEFNPEKNPDKKDEKEIRETYDQTSWGKKSKADLAKLRTDFGYNAIDAYLFDNHKLNYLGQAITTYIAYKNDRIYYLNDKTVIALVERVGQEAVLNRFDSKCKVSEIVSFSKLNDFENSIRLKVTQKYCTSSHNKGSASKYTEHDIKGWGAYFQNLDKVEDQMEAQELCSQWLPKPEPVGLVIESTSKPEKTISKKKTKKQSKSKSAAKRKKKISANEN